MTTESYLEKAKSSAAKAAQSEKNAALADKKQALPASFRTIQNITENSTSQRAANAANALLEIMNDYSAAAKQAALKKNQNLASAALYKAKASLSLWKNEYDFAVKEAKTANKKEYNAVRKSALEDKVSAYRKLNSLKADNLLEKIGALK